MGIWGASDPGISRVKDTTNVKTDTSPIAGSGPSVKAERRRSPWPVTAAIIVAGLIALGALFWESTFEIIDLWTRMSAYNHSFLIIPMSLFIIASRRSVIARMNPRSEFRWLLLVLVFGPIWLIAQAADLAEGRHIALIGMAQILLVTACGWKIYKALLFPFLFLWLLVPTGGFLLPTLQSITTSVAVEGLRLSGIPVFTEGIVVQVPTSVFLIVEGCAGLNFLLASLAISLLYGNMMYTRWFKRIACVVLMLTVSVIANSIRVYGIITIAEISNRKLDIVDDHLLYGWGFFIIILFLMMWVGQRFRDPEGEGETYLAPVQTADEPLTQYLRCAGAVAAVVAAVAAAPAYAAYVESDHMPGAVQLPIPSKAGSWTRSAASGDWNPVFPGADTRVLRTFEMGERRVDLFVAYYRRQGKGRELIGQQNRIAGDKEWLRLSIAKDGARIDGVSREVGVVRLASGDRRRLVWQWYWVDGKFTANATIAKLLQAKVNLLYGEQRAAFLALSVEENEQSGDSRVALQAVLDAIGPLQTMLEAATHSAEDD